MTQGELIKLLSGIKKRVSSNVMRTIRRILALATEYSYLGKQFTFDANADLNDEVNRILVELSDAILDDLDAAVMKTIEDDEDSDAVFAYVYRTDNGVGLDERVDYHSSNLKYLLEGYFAVCFANGLTNADILGDVLLYLSNPNAYGKMKEAFKDSGYASTFIINGGFHFGKGVNTNPIDGLDSLSRFKLSEGYHYDKLLGYRKNPNIIGYRVVRGSDYDCPSCNELCVGIHPLTEQCLPNHINCVCREVPVYADEIM